MELLFVLLDRIQHIIYTSNHTNGTYSWPLQISANCRIYPNRDNYLSEEKISNISRYLPLTLRINGIESGILIFKEERYFFLAALSNSVKILAKY